MGIIKVIIEVMLEVKFDIKSKARIISPCHVIVSFSSKAQDPFNYMVYNHRHDHRLQNNYIILIHGPTFGVLIPPTREAYSCCRTNVRRTQSLLQSTTHHHRRS